ncbi:MAG: RHS repeat protein, partial [Alphaproteobacteria bacterium]|nr:RHS repeat protein [Alphaproteobacteria bacterium]
MRRILGNIIFIILFFYSAPAFALTSGTTTSGSISAGGTSSQSFSGTAGQGVLLYADATYTVIIKVYKPDGTFWGQANNRFSGTLPDSGAYNVELSGTYPTDSGSYSLDYVRGSDGVSNGSLTSGASYNGNLSENGLESFQITGTTGQSILLYSDSTYTTNIYVYNPDGSYWSGAGNRFTGTLPSDGTYTVVFTGAYPNYTGSYRFDYLRGADGVSNGTISSGQNYNGDLAENGIESFQIAGVAGQDFLIFADASYTTLLHVYNTDGSLWRTTPNRFIDTFPSSGTYTVVFTGAYPNYSGDYRVDYVRASGSVSSGTLVSGSTRSNSLQENGLQSYVFTGSTSNSLTVSSTGAYTRKIRVYKPDGSYWTIGNNSLSKTLPSDGAYTLVVYGNYTSNEGPYTITLTTPPQTVADTDATKEGLCNLSCEELLALPKKEVSDPINFDVGYLRNTEVDYNAGGLRFSRIYRSDSTWTDNTLGERWRHNYARTLDVTSTTVAITDGTGATTNYTLSGSDWVPDDDNTTATFEDDGSGGYIYTLPNNIVEKYNSSEQLTRIEYLGGGALNLSYNGSGELTSVTNENGRQISLTYSSGRVTTMTSPDGTYSYSYDTNGNLETVTKPDTNTIGYHYEDTSYIHALTGVTDESGVRFSSFGYDTNGKAILAERAGNVESVDISYNSGQTSTTTNELGKDTTYYYTNIWDVRKIVQMDGAATTNTAAASRYFNYDDKGRLIGKTDWENNTTRYQYDDRGNITKIIKAAGETEQQTTTITYDPTYNLPDLVTESGKTTDYDYDTYGRLTSVTVTDTATSETRITTYSYYSNSTDGSGNTILGRLEEVNGPRTDVADTTTYAYDSNYNLTTITNALSQVTTITARDSAGRPTTVEDPNGVETDFVYDTNGRLQSLTRAVGTALEAETTYDYDDNGNLTKVTLPSGAYLQ